MDVKGYINWPNRRTEVPMDPTVWYSTPLCGKCYTWGRTVTREECPGAVPCECGRLTWPNLGVNLPAGAAVCVGGNNAASILNSLSPESRKVLEQMEVTTTQWHAIPGLPVLPINWGPLPTLLRIEEGGWDQPVDWSPLQLGIDDDVQPDHVVGN